MNKTEEKRFLKKLGKNIKHYRKQTRLTQKELARAINKNVRFISKLERGRFDIYITMLYKICKALRITSAQILDFE